MATLMPEQILSHREKRKRSGLIGCKDGSDTPLGSLSGISWRPEDPMSPHCFCHDCRTTWDPEGTIDVELITAGNTRARFTYASLLPSKKETLLELMTLSDDALEDFVKAQLRLVQTTETLAALQNTRNIKRTTYDHMNGQGYEFVKTYEVEIDTLHDELARIDRQMRPLKDEVAELETECNTMGHALTAARMKMRTFLDTNF